MDTTEIKLSFRAECEVFYGEEIFTEEFNSQISEELEENENYSDSSFGDYQKMCQATLGHLNYKAEKTWEKLEPPTAINLKITPIQ